MSEAAGEVDELGWRRSLAAAYGRDAGYLWGLGYRLTGSAALAEDLVQETFVRALRRPPADRGAPLRPWLTRVAVNLGIDALRRRRARAYDGPWLPEPIDTAALVDPGADVEAQSAGREGLTLAFVALLERLSPQQRAVVILRDVLGLSVGEAAAALGVAEGNVKVAHHRARARLGVTLEPSAPAPTVCERHQALLGALFAAIAAGDQAQVVGLLASDVEVITDGGGVVRAARRVVRGADDVARLLLGLARKGPPVAGMRMREINCLPALEIDAAADDPRNASRMIFQVVVGADGAIAQILSVLAPAKLAGLGRGPWARPLVAPASLGGMGEP
ncbi:MAG: sigma-70 family RNA polymerase sigma factor [Myxococcales bacterium]|nr:sigma-70 family RNA polymerase sigma factor [Myxococcales bacterium]